MTPPHVTWVSGGEIRTVEIPPQDPGESGKDYRIRIGSIVADALELHPPD